MLVQMCLYVSDLLAGNWTSHHASIVGRFKPTLDEDRLTRECQRTSERVSFSLRLAE